MAWYTAGLRAFSANFIAQNLNRKVYSHPAVKIFVAFIDHVHKSKLCDPTLRRLHPDHTIASYVSKIIFNNILPSEPKDQNDVLPKVYRQTSYVIYHFLH
jgi:hypothetical protein